MGRPSLVGQRTKAVYYEGQVGLPDAACLPMLNKSWTITASIEVPDDKAEGMIVTHGGLEGGYGLYLRKGRPVFVYNYLSIDRPTFVADQPLAKGKHELVVRFEYDGGGMGKGGTITLSADGRKLAGGRMDKTVPIQFSLGEGLDIGMDVGSPIDFTYRLPFKFTGKIEKVIVEIEPLAMIAKSGVGKRVAEPAE
jgi:arylsulfatase